MGHSTHDAHSHTHGAGCGHRSIEHAGHMDYLHDGHLHHTHEGHIDEHALEVAGKNAASCTPQHACGGTRRTTVTAPDAAMKWCRTGITTTTWSAAICTNHMGSTATTTGQ